MATLQSFFGGARTYTEAELALTLAQLTAADQVLCSSGDVAHVAVGSGLLLVDVSFPANRKLVETFTLTHLASNPFGLEALQGTTGFTLQEAMRMCGAGLFAASLSDIYMALFEGPAGEVEVIEASQLVRSTGVSGLSPASLKELVSITTSGMLVGLNVASTATAVTLTSDTAVPDESPHRLLYPSHPPDH